MRISVSLVNPPIPTRRFDYCAVDSDSYDGADDSNCPIGYGATEREAALGVLEALAESGEDLPGFNHEQSVIGFQITMVDLACLSAINRAIDRMAP